MLRYRVKPNDTLNGIAASHRVTLTALVAANAALAAAPAVLVPGTVLQIPCEPKASAEATKATAVDWATRAVKFLEDYAANPSFGSEVVVQTHWHLDKDLKSKPRNL